MIWESTQVRRGKLLLDSNIGRILGDIFLLTFLRKFDPQTRSSSNLWFPQRIYFSFRGNTVLPELFCDIQEVMKPRGKWHSIVWTKTYGSLKFRELAISIWRDPSVLTTMCCFFIVRMASCALIIFRTEVNMRIRIISVQCDSSRTTSNSFKSYSRRPKPANDIIHELICKYVAGLFIWCSYSGSACWVL